MHKKIAIAFVFAFGALLMSSSSFCSEERKQRQNPQISQKGLLNLRIEEEKQKKILQTKYKKKAWIANKAGKFTGTLYSIEARLTSPILLSSGDFHQRLYKREEQSRRKLVKWACGDIADIDQNDIAEIAELASWQGHCSAFGDKMESWSFTLATEQKMKVTEGSNPKSPVLKFIKQESA